MAHGGSQEKQHTRLTQFRESCVEDGEVVQCLCRERERKKTASILPFNFVLCLTQQTPIIPVIKMSEIKGTTDNS
jgi:hypothetical protein